MKPESENYQSDLLKRLNIEPHIIFSDIKEEYTVLIYEIINVILAYFIR